MGTRGSETPYESYKLGAGGVSLPKSDCSVTHLSQGGNFQLYLVSSKLPLTNYQRKLLSSQLVLQERLTLWPQSTGNLCCRSWTRVCLSTGPEWLMYLMTLMNRTASIVCWAWMPSPREPQSPRHLSQRPRRGLPAIPAVAMQMAVPNPKQRLRKGLDHCLLRLQRRRMRRSRHNSRVNSCSRHTKEIHIHRLSRKDSHCHQRGWRTLRIW